MVFFVVLVSALVQGWSLPLVARWLGLGRPAEPSPPLSVELHALRHIEGDIVEYTVAPSARVAGRALRELAFPEGIAVTLVVRADEIIVPRGATELCPGDHVFVALRTRLKPLMDRLFDPNAETPPLAPHTAIAFDAQSTLGQLRRFFGFPELPASEEPVGALLKKAEEGAPLRLGPFLVAPGDDPEFVTLTCAPTLASAPDIDDESTGALSLSTPDA